MSAINNADPDWIVPEWPAPRNVRALITTRAGGVSGGPYASLNLGRKSGDSAENVAANRKRLRSAVPADPVWLSQVHGVAVVDADSCDAGTEADASFSREAKTVCAVSVADCLPVLFTDSNGATVAAAHAGWRGLCAGVIESTVDAMGVAPSSLLAYLGPCIGAKVYEVGSEVRDAFCAVDSSASLAFLQKANGKWLADLPAIARQRLARIGVTQVFGGTNCTYSEPSRFYSHRRDAGVTGRMVALIWRE